MLRDDLANLLRQIERAQVHAVLATEASVPAPDVFVRSFGPAVGVINREIRNTLFNRVTGVGEEEADCVREIVAWFESHSIPPRLDICPQRRGARLTAALRAACLAPEPHPGFTRRIMVRDLRTNAGAAAQPSAGAFFVRLVESDDDVRSFIDIQITTWPDDGVRAEALFQQVRSSTGRSDILRYLARVDHRPIATAALALAPPIGWLSTGAVLPEARRRGIQSALIAQRMRDARVAGCTHVASLVTPESGSERNLRRAGFTLACDRELWLPPDWTDHPFYCGAG